MTIVICQFTWRWPAATTGGLVVVAGYLLGAYRTGLPDHGLIQVAIFGIQIISSALLMWLIRRAASAADTALTQRGRQQAQAGAQAARRRTEREHNRQLHDTVLATLTIVGTGAIAASTGTLRQRALDDLALIEALDRPPRIPAPRRPGSGSPAVPLHERLTEVRAGTPTWPSSCTWWTARYPRRWPRRSPAPPGRRWTTCWTTPVPVGPRWSWRPTPAGSR